MSHVDKGCAREALATPYIPVKSKKEQRFLLYRIFYGKEPVYIGRTKQPLQNRLRGHFFQKPMHRTIDIEMVSRVQYAEFPTEADMNLYEIYFILTRHPPLNVDDKTRDYPTVTLPDVEWKDWYSPIFERWKKEIAERVSDAEKKRMRYKAITEEIRVVRGLYRTGEISEDEKYDRLEALQAEQESIEKTLRR